jgi:hypothetical protein
MRCGGVKRIGGKEAMIEVMVRFENLRQAVDAQEPTVSGSVVALGNPERPAVRFDGWLQLLSILESLSSPPSEAPLPPLPSPGTPHRWEGSS